LLDGITQIKNTMKTSLKIEQFRAVFVLFGAIVMLTVGCKQATDSL